MRTFVILYVRISPVIKYINKVPVAFCITLNDFHISVVIVKGSVILFIRIRKNAFSLTALLSKALITNRVVFLAVSVKLPGTS